MNESLRVGLAPSRREDVPESSGGNFDGIARAYRYLEYLALGPLLQRTRTQFVDRLGSRRRAVLLGDGDGRFLVALLASNQRVNVDAVDTSARMLSLLYRRAEACMQREGGSVRVKTHHESALLFVPTFAPDLIVTHFFFDCLQQGEVTALIRRLAPRVAAGGLWLVSEFRIPRGLFGVIAWSYVRLLYLAFRWITGLRTTALSDHVAVLMETGFVRVACRRRLFGLLTSELWEKRG